MAEQSKTQSVVRSASTLAEPQAILPKPVASGYETAQLPALPKSQPSPTASTEQKDNRTKSSPSGEHPLSHAENFKESFKKGVSLEMLSDLGSAFDPQRVSSERAHEMKDAIKTALGIPQAMSLRLYRYQSTASALHDTLQEPQSRLVGFVELGENRPTLPFEFHISSGTLKVDDQIVVPGRFQETVESRIRDRQSLVNGFQQKLTREDRNDLGRFYQVNAQGEDVISEKRGDELCEKIQNALNIPPRMNLGFRSDNSGNIVLDDGRLSGAIFVYDTREHASAKKSLRDKLEFSFNPQTGELLIEGSIVSRTDVPQRIESLLKERGISKTLNQVVVEAKENKLEPTFRGDVNGEQIIVYQPQRGVILGNEKDAYQTRVGIENVIAYIGREDKMNKVHIYSLQSDMSGGFNLSGRVNGQEVTLNWRNTDFEIQRDSATNRWHRAYREGAATYNGQVVKNVVDQF